MALDIDLDAILAKREEVTGSKDRFTFTFAGQTWSAIDPIVADDDWKDELAECESDPDVAEHYLGTEQYEQFLAAGGRAGYLVLAVRQFMEEATAETDAGPTRSSRSSARRQKRSKRR
ncbi:hypothetical protein [Rhodococcus daqingensis]|uniref:Tail assembly chaperone n=1 Tax=Rhodococcus daqingensis TaxID=2479363 RepID=A0ABW2S322_9NOCA